MVGGNAIWDLIKWVIAWVWNFKWQVGLPMIFAFLWGGWDRMTSPFGATTLLGCLIVFCTLLFVMFLTSEVLSHWKMKSTDSDQPRFVIDPVSEFRMVVEDPPSTGNSLVSIALLRVTNRPESPNRNAVAEGVYAWVSYCDVQWNEYFPPFRGIWVAPRYTDDPFEIGNLTEDFQSLSPNEFMYLGIAIAEIFHDGDLSSQNPLAYGVVTLSMRQWVGGVNANYALHPLAEDDSIRIKVILGCHGYEITHRYLLQEKTSGSNATKNQLILIPL